jgi:predicted SAM-dependent methyltransferase
MNTDSAPLRLHLGCGKRYLPGFVHVDIADFPHIDHRARVDKLPFVADESVELIYCSHMLEYRDRFQVMNVLAEWRRVLKPDGVLRLAVPDFDALIEVYKRTGDITKILGPLFGRMDVGLEEPIYHRTVYNLASLREVLESAGFKDVRGWDWRKVFPPGYDDHSQAYFPHMDKENGILVSLNVEATR